MNISEPDSFHGQHELYIPYLVMYSFGAIIGSCGNLLIMTSILITKALQNSTNTLIFNLAIADLIISAVVDSTTVITYFFGEKIVKHAYGLCEFIAALCLVSCATSMLNIGFLAFNRYVNICHNNYYKKIFTRRKTLLFCVLTWTIGILEDVPNIAGWGGHTFDLETRSCLWNRKANHGYTLFFPLTTIVIPCICIFVFYLKIFFYVRNSKQEVYLKRKASRRSIQISKALFGSFLLFTVSWLPYGLYVMSDFNHTHSMAGHVYTLLIAHLNSAFNAIFYLYNPAFRKGYSNVLNLIFRRNKTPSKTRYVKTVSTLNKS